ncbi:MAG: hypothetical protein JKX73_03550 [Flavobacteriales bacterium]|nr:hypothetical protein [Flavobacteriales bacterium]
MNKQLDIRQYGLMEWFARSLLLLGLTVICSENLVWKKLSTLDIHGRLVYCAKDFNGLSLALDLDPAMYFVQLESKGAIEGFKITIQ